MRRALSLIIIAALALSGVALAPRAAEAQVDTTANAAFGVVSTGYDAAATSIVLTAGHGARFGSTFPMRAVWYNFTDYPGGVDASGATDPNLEWISITARSTDTLTVTRAAEGPSASTKNTGGKTYWIVAVPVTAASWNALVTSLGSTPQGLRTTSDVRFDSLGLGIAAEGTTGTLQFPTSNAIIFPYQPASTTNGISLYPKGFSAKSWFIFAKGAAANDTAPDENQAFFRIFASPGANSVFGAGYYNPLISWGAHDGTNAVRAFELGVEGTMTSGVFNDHKMYLWQFNASGGSGRTVWAVDNTTNPNQFRFPWPDAAESGNYVRIGGRQISTQVDGSVAMLDLSPGATAATGTGNYTKNDANTRTFHNVLIRPEYKFGASNANTFVISLSLDSTNTDLTGTTVIPIRVAHGGTEFMRVTSAGYVGVGTTPLTPFHAVDGSVGFLSDVWAASTQGAGMIVRKGRGTAAAPRRAKSGDNLGIYNARGAFAVDDSTAATFSSNNSGQFVYVATEDHTSTAQGAKFELSTTATGTTTATTRLRIDDTGTQVLQAFVLSGDDQPSQIAAATNDYAISSTAAVTVVDADQTRALTGMTGGADGRMHTIINKGTAADSVIILRANDAASTAANRFEMPRDVVLEAGNAASFWYDSTASRWKLRSTSGQSAAVQEKYLPFYATDFLGVTGAATLEAHLPWDLGLISSGTQSKVAGDGVRRGILLCTSSTTTNSGCQVATDLTAIRLVGGEYAEYVINPITLTTSTFRFGYLDSITSTDETDGAYIEVPSTGAAVCKTANNTTRTTSSTIATLSTSTWYRLRIAVDNTAANVTCTIFDANGNSLGAQTNSANIPTSAGREVGHGYVLTNSGTTAVGLVQVDYMSMGTTRAIVR
jgi:hypothetical protein